MAFRRNALQLFDFRHLPQKFLQTIAPQSRVCGLAGDFPPSLDYGGQALGMTRRVSAK
jgi:hypothetical protein